MSITTVRIDDDQLTDLAAQVAERLAGQTPQPTGLVDAETVALALGVTRGWVYEHAELLGAMRLGKPGAPVRFDLDRVRAAFAAQHEKPTPQPRRRRPRHHSPLAIGA